MGPRSTGRIVLLSIKPDYAEAIFAGRKTVEFRRSRIGDDVQFIIVYATQPVGRIIGWFEVGGVVEATPSKLWRDFSDVGAVDRRSYLDYFADAKRAFGIIVRGATRLPVPAGLDEIRIGLRPPQSFQYVSSEAAASVLAV